MRNDDIINGLELGSPIDYAEVNDSGKSLVGGKNEPMFTSQIPDSYIAHDELPVGKILPIHKKADPSGFVRVVTVLEGKRVELTVVR